MPSRCCIIIIIHRPHEYDHLEKTPSLCLPYVADDSLLCKLGSGVCPSLKHLDVQVASNFMTLMLVMMTMIIITLIRTMMTMTMMTITMTMIMTTMIKMLTM